MHSKTCAVKGARWTVIDPLFQHPRTRGTIKDGALLEAVWYLYIFIKAICKKSKDPIFHNFFSRFGYVLMFWGTKFCNLRISHSTVELSLYLTSRKANSSLLQTVCIESEPIVAWPKRAMSWASSDFDQQPAARATEPIDDQKGIRIKLFNTWDFLLLTITCFASVLGVEKWCDWSLGWDTAHTTSNTRMNDLSFNWWHIF